MSKSGKTTKITTQVVTATSVDATSVNATSVDATSVNATSVDATSVDATLVDVEKKIRLQVGNVLGVNISHARCLSHLKYHLTDASIDAQVKEIKLQQKTTPSDDSAARIAILTKNYVRISSETPIALATVCDGFVKEFIRHGMQQAIAVDRKSVDVKHLLSGDVKGLVYYPMFKNLPTFINYVVEEKKEEKKEEVAPVADSGAESESEESSAQTSFVTYVENAIKSLKKEEAFSTLRINTRVREYVSDLVTDLIHRISVLSKVIVQRVINVKTMTADHIKSVVLLILVDSLCSEEVINGVLSNMNDKIKLYQDHLKSERTKKESLLDDATKEENESKLKLKEFERKKKQSDMVNQRVKDNTEKAKVLKKEVEQMQKVTAK